MAKITNSEDDLLRLCPVVSTTEPFYFRCFANGKQVHLATPRNYDVLIKWVGVVSQREETTTYSKADATKYLLNGSWLVVHDQKIIQK